MYSKISFAYAAESDFHYRQLKKLVYERLSLLPSAPLQFARIRALAFITLFIAVYSLALNQRGHLISYYALFAFLGVMIVFIFLNLVHEAVHGNLFRNKNSNQIMLYFFDIMGANSYIWKKRHTILHHNYPNVSGWDSDIEQASLFKIFPHDPQQPIHRVQHRTFVLLYPLYLVNWLFVRDFKDFFSKKQVVRKVCTIPVMEYCKLIFFKSFFIFYTLVIPVMYRVPLSHAIVAMLTMVIVAGIFALLVLLTPHVNVTNRFPLADKDLRIQGGWLQHQFSTTNDVDGNNWFMQTIMGNFNFHIAHHLFPHVSYVYAAEVTDVIRNYAEKNNLAYRSYSIFSALKYHYQLIRSNAVNTSFFEEDM